MLSVTCRSPRMLGEPCGMAGKCGRPSSAILSLPEEPRILKLRTCETNSSGRSPAFHDVQEGAAHIQDWTPRGRLDLLAIGQHHAAGAPIAHQDLLHRRAAADAAAAGLERGASACVTAPMPPRAKPQAPTAPSMLPM
jgi:hypothetical protein